MPVVRTRPGLSRAKSREWPCYEKKPRPRVAGLTGGAKGVFGVMWRGIGQIGQVGRVGLMGQRVERKENSEDRIQNVE